MVMGLVLLFAAFEYSLSSMPVTAVLSGIRQADWCCYSLSPTSAAGVPRLGAMAACTKPYGIDRLLAGQLAVAGRLGTLGLVGAVHSLHFSGYGETDLQLSSGIAADRLVFGASAHLLMSSDIGRAQEFVPAFDAGVAWRNSSFILGLDARRFNTPIVGGGIVPTRFVFSGSWFPAADFAARAELSAAQQEQAAALAAEFRLAGIAAVRAGIGTTPLRYAFGLGVERSGCSFGYCYELNPVLGGSHIVQIAASWRR